jgi:hypothetical protein
MDLLAEIRGKAEALAGHAALKSVQAVVRHVGIAERHLLRARTERDEDLFNDVIYRTNQAFEGILKAAYTVIASGDGSKLNPSQIEKFLAGSEALSARVLELFTNYRQKWRNPSTHEHELFFNEQEALLAIVSVSAFTLILLDQIIERVNHDREKEDLRRRKGKGLIRIESYQEMPLHVQVLSLLRLFTEELAAGSRDPSQHTEVEIIGKLSGFLDSYDPTINRVREPLLNGNHRPDFLLSRGNERVILEVKRPSVNPRTLALGRNQLLQYLEVSKLRHGILYIPPALGERLRMTDESTTVENREVSLFLLAPEFRKGNAPNQDAAQDG